MKKRLPVQIREALANPAVVLARRHYIIQRDFAGFGCWWWTFYYRGTSQNFTLPLDRFPRSERVQREIMKAQDARLEKMRQEALAKQ
jgi:hypothetical protein